MRSHLSFRLKVLATLMRRMPTRVRRVAWWWTRLYAAIGGGGFAEDPNRDKTWPAGLQRPVRGKHHSYRMVLNLQDWLERRAYFSGSYYQKEIEQLLLHLVRQGDQFIDVGANIGMITLIAASRFGPIGRGYVCEPNPHIVPRLKRHLDSNHLTNIEVIPYALSDNTGRAKLHIQSKHSGLGTLAAFDAQVAQIIEIETRCGDEVLLSRVNPQRPVIVKIDVEGFECYVLRGMPRLLELPNIAVVVEVTDHMLRRAGDSVRALYRLLHEKGCIPHTIHVAQERWRSRLELRRTNAPANAEYYDVLFAKPTSALYSSRIAPLLSATKR